MHGNFHYCGIMQHNIQDGPPSANKALWYLAPFVYPFMQGDPRKNRPSIQQSTTRNATQHTRTSQHNTTQHNAVKGTTRQRYPIRYKITPHHLITRHHATQSRTKSNTNARRCVAWWSVWCVVCAAWCVVWRVAWCGCCGVWLCVSGVWLVCGGVVWRGA